MTGEASFMLSDFSTETLVKDGLKWKIRVEEGRVFFLSYCIFKIISVVVDIFRPQRKIR